MQHWIQSFFWPKPIQEPIKILEEDLIKTAKILKKTFTVVKQHVPLEVQLLYKKRHLSSPVQQQFTVVQPEFLLCRASLRKTTIQKPKEVLEIPSPLFTEMIQKYEMRQKRLQHIRKL